MNRKQRALGWFPCNNEQRALGEFPGLVPGERNTNDGGGTALVLVISDRGSDRLRVRDVSFLAVLRVTARTTMMRAQPLGRRTGRIRPIRSPGTSPGNQPCARCYLFRGNSPRARSYLFQATSPRTQPQKQVRSQERAT
jgi:hypothetical protein